MIIRNHPTRALHWGCGFTERLRTLRNYPITGWSLRWGGCRCSSFGGSSLTALRPPHPQPSPLVLSPHPPSPVTSSPEGWSARGCGRRRGGGVCWWGQVQVQMRPPRASQSESLQAASHHPQTHSQLPRSSVRPITYPSRPHTMAS
eukprot:188893-Rhodomonas_salina.1